MRTSTYVSPSALGEAHRLNRLHNVTIEAIRECCTQLDAARDEKTVTQAFVSFTELAHSYGSFTDNTATYWRRVFRIIEEENLPTDVFYRLLVWAGVLEMEKHTT